MAVFREPQRRGNNLESFINANKYGEKLPADRIALELLRSGLGPVRIAYAMGLDETTAVHDWAEGLGVPSSAQRERLDLLYDALITFSKTEALDTAVALVIGLNPDLGDRSIIRLIKESNDVVSARKEVMNAIYTYFGKN